MGSTACIIGGIRCSRYLVWLHEGYEKNVNRPARVTESKGYIDCFPEPQGTVLFH